MKFSKLLTTAMMSVALVASSSAFAAEETPWWSMDFDGLAIEEGGTLTNALNAAYATTQNGWWTSEEGDLTTFENDKLKLNTQGTDLTWTPNADNDTTAITYIDADVTFVGSDTAPTVSETDVHTAVYLKNIADDTTGEVTNSVLCAWGRTGQEAASWVELTGATLVDGQTYSLRIMLEGEDLSFFINDTQMTTLAGATAILSAKDGSEGEVNSVSFRGTGFVDNFAASQEAAAVIETASIVGDKVFLDNVDVTADWSYMFYLNEEYNGQTVQLTGDAYNTATIWNVATNPDTYQDLGPIAAIKLVSDTQSFEIVYDSKTGTFSGDATLSVNPIADQYGTMYEVYVDTDELVADAQYTLEFYYGEYTPSENPDPKPVQLGTPSVEVTTTANSVTLTWDAVDNATGYEVTFNGETTTVTDATFTVSNLTASTDYSYSVVAKGDGVNYTDSVAATGTATTAAAEVTVVEPDPIKISAISGPVEGNVVVTVVPAAEGGKIKAGVNYWAVVSATLGGDETAQDPVTVPEDTDSLQITVPATGDSLFIKVKADTATAE